MVEFKQRLVKYIHTGIALLVVLSGLVNIGSALFPAFPERFRLLHDLFSVEIIQSAQTATVVFGLLLIILSVGLEGKRKRAMQFVLVLLLLECFTNLLKGLDFEETIYNGLLALLLFSQRKQFTIQSPSPSFKQIMESTSTTLLLFYAYVFAGFFILQNRITPHISFFKIVEEPFYLIFATPHFRYMRRQAHWFADSIVYIGCLTILYIVIQLIRPLIPKFSESHLDKEKAKELVKQYGIDSLSYFTLQDGRKYFFHHNGNAVLSYKLWGNVAIVGSDPVGQSHAARQLLGTFISNMKLHGVSVGFMSMSPVYIRILRQLGFIVLKIGEEAVINLRTFDFDKLDKKVRRAYAHVLSNNIKVEIYKRPTLPYQFLVQAEKIYYEWFAKRGGVQTFSMGLGRFPKVSDVDVEFICAIKQSELLGFLIMVPIYLGNGKSLDVMPRKDHTINGLNEFLIISAAQIYKKQGYASMSLNFATFLDSKKEIDSVLVKQAQQVIYNNAPYTYQLRSLYLFNKKFLPDWRSRYIAYSDKRLIPKLTFAFLQSERPIRLPQLAPIQFIKKRWIRLYNVESS